MTLEAISEQSTLGPQVSPGSSGAEFYDKKYRNGEEVPKTSKAFAIDLIPQNKTLRVLDVGCGTGTNSRLIAARGHRVRGIDISEAAIAKYQANGFEGAVCDVERSLIPMPDTGFDVVFCAEVLEHLLDPVAALRKLNKVLDPGGVLILTVPNSSWWVYRLAAVFGKPVSELQHPKHYQFFSKASLKRVIDDAGFVDCQIIGRNMYLVFPNIVKRVTATLLPKYGWTLEKRFTTGKDFWHLSNNSSFCNSLFADTFIVKATRP